VLLQQLLLQEVVQGDVLDWCRFGAAGRRH
jgi:hypothetical protein